MTGRGAIDQVLERARWAPSGDNTQPWRFERVSPDSVRIVVRDTRRHCVYDLDGRPTQLSAGALLESMFLAAGAIGRRLEWKRLPSGTEERTVLEVRLGGASESPPDPLHAYLETRSVQRGLLRPRRLTSAEKSRIESAVGADHRVVWLESAVSRWRTAVLLWRVAHFRLSLPEAYDVHRDVIEWGAEVSEDRMPDRSIVPNAALRWAMRFVLKSAARVRWFNRWLGGAWSPGFLMDFLPQLACGAQVLLLAERPPSTVDDFLESGRAVQRLWLAVTREGLWHQPAYTPIQFNRYLREGRAFTADGAVEKLARRLNAAYERWLPTDPARVVWLGRVGAGSGPRFRSLRIPLERLWSSPA